MRQLIQNFRGRRAALLHGPDRNRAMLGDTLTRLGLKIEAADPLDGAGAIREVVKDADLLFFDADLAETVAQSWAGEPVLIPVIAIVGLEAPGRLSRAFELEPAAVLYKPLRSTGIYSALFFAANEHKRRQELARRLQELEARHRSRRFVVQAVVRLMQARGIDDDQAYRHLRKESMRRRLTVEEVAAQVLAAGSSLAAKAAREA